MRVSGYWPGVDVPQLPQKDQFNITLFLIVHATCAGVLVISAIFVAAHYDTAELDLVVLSHGKAWRKAVATI